MSIIKHLQGFITESHLLKEAFGFDYRFPEDKNEAIYDFYALSLVNPDSITDEDLKFSMERAKKENTEKMKAWLLEAVRRAISAEIFHFQPFWNEDQEKEWKEKTQYPQLFDRFKKVINPENTAYHGASNTNYQQRYDKIKTLKLTDDDLFKFAADIFGADWGDHWHHAYGGKAWRTIAEAGKKLYESEKDPSVWIDHVIDLQHNTGSIFTKWKGLDVDNRTLDAKRDITNLRTYTKLVSSTLEAALTHLTRREIGKEEKDKIKRAKGMSTYRPEPEKPKAPAEPKWTTKELKKKIIEIAEGDWSTAQIEEVENKIIDDMNGWDSDYSTQEVYFNNNTKNIKKYFIPSLTKLKNSFGIDPNDRHNIKLVLDNIDEIADEGGIKTRLEIIGHSTESGNFKKSEGYNQFLVKLLGKDWKFLGTESFDTLMNRLTVEAKTERFKHMNFDYIEKWLRTQYKKNPKEFEKFSDRFIPEFEKLIKGGKDTPSGGQHPLKNLTDKQKDFIKELISKVSGSEYEKEAKKNKEPKMKGF